MPGRLIMCRMRTARAKSVIPHCGRALADEFATILLCERCSCDQALFGKYEGRDYLEQFVASSVSSFENCTNAAQEILHPISRICFNTEWDTQQMVGEDG